MKEKKRRFKDLQVKLGYAVSSRNPKLSGLVYKVPFLLKQFLLAWPLILQKVAFQGV